MFFFGAGGSKANKNWKTGGQFSGKTRRSPPPPETGETNLGHQVTKKRPGKWLPPLCVTTGSCRILWKICFVRKNIYIKEVQSDCFWLSWVAVLLQFVLSTCFFSSAHLQKHVEPQRDIKKAWIRQSFLVDFNFHRQSKCCNPNSFELFRSSRTFHPFVVGHEQVHLNRPRQWKKQSWVFKRSRLDFFLLDEILFPQNWISQFIEVPVNTTP